MATNFFERWSSRKLTAVEKSEPLESTDNDVTDGVGRDKPECVDCENTAVDKIANTDSSHQSPAIADAAIISESAITPEPVVELTIDDADKVTYESGVASFMQQQVTKSVKKAALRKLFHSQEFNYISDMDDSTEDFSNMEGLAPEIASQMRGWINSVTETATEKLKEDGLSALTSPPTTADVLESPLDSNADAVIDTETDDSIVTDTAITAIEDKHTDNDLLVNSVDGINIDKDAVPKNKH
ncbi:hypothetical protein PMAL9190_00304 [Photobacterium malacitanum]|uniref:DUF3306 domain-containing protein n=1 Tax=Photobacterium malacitanum TaxID=2204294 RepID=A0A1Y6M8B9_9GAMM|nr:DUF3306 domain-containing protein [Photobacterium malacitanum]SMY31998.1 hypothetical protein PMAL9190_00304 [Photobacterium malacitanum]